MDSVMCVSHTQHKEESAFMGLPSHHSICPSQLKYQMKKLWLKESVLYDQLFSSFSYATLFTIRNGIFMLFAYSWCQPGYWYSQANHNPAIFSVPPGTGKLSKSPQVDKKPWFMSNILHMFNNNTYADFRTAYKHILIASYII